MICGGGGAGSTATTCCSLDDEVARRLGLLAKELHRIHHFARLREERVAQVTHPFRLLAQHREHLRKRHQRLHARIPRLVLHGLHRGVTLHAAMGKGPIDRERHVRRIGGRHQHLRQQRVGKQRDGCEHLVELRMRERRGLGGARRAHGQQACDDQRRGSAEKTWVHWDDGREPADMKRSTPCRLYLGGRARTIEQRLTACPTLRVGGFRSLIFPTRGRACADSRVSRGSSPRARGRWACRSAAASCRRAGRFRLPRRRRVRRARSDSRCRSPGSS